MTPEQLALRAIECHLDLRRTSENPAIRQDAWWLYPKWKDDLIRHGCIETFKTNAWHGMNALAWKLADEAWSAAHGIEPAKEWRTSFDDIREDRWPGNYRPDRSDLTKAVKEGT